MDDDKVFVVGLLWLVHAVWGSLSGLSVDRIVRANAWSKRPWHTHPLALVALFKGDSSREFSFLYWPVGGWATNATIVRTHIWIARHWYLPAAIVVGVYFFLQGPPGVNRSDALLIAIGGASFIFPFLVTWYVVRQLGAVGRIPRGRRK